VGMVTNLRKLVTKNNDTMCIATIEDLFGTMDVVLFPRTWRTYEDLVTADAVLKFTGKVDVTRNEPQILCDAVSSDFSYLTADTDANSNGNGSAASVPSLPYDEPPWISSDDEPPPSIPEWQPPDFSGPDFSDEFQTDPPMPVIPARCLIIHFDRSSDH